MEVFPPEVFSPVKSPDFGGSIDLGFQVADNPGHWDAPGGHFGVEEEENPSDKEPGAAYEEGNSEVDSIAEGSLG